MGKKKCGLCSVRVESKSEHLKYVHGWVDCACCRNAMARSDLKNHMLLKHNHQMLGPVVSATQALESKPNQKAVAKNDTEAKKCCHCKCMVHSMVEHLTKKHGYVRCKFCTNIMGPDSMDTHVKRSHGQNVNKIQDLKSKPENDIDKIQSQTEFNVPKLLPSNKFLQPASINPPTVDMSNIYELVAEKTKALFINAPQTCPVANVKKTYFNTILISDKELNKLMADGRIESQQGQLILRDS